MANTNEPKPIEDFPIYEIAKPDLRRYGKPSRIKYPRRLTEDQHKQLQEDFRQRFARERFFGNGTVSYVYQRRLDPPCYIIFPNFPKLARVISDLNLPKDRQATYYSTFRRGGDYLGATGKTYEKCQLFNVELFGMRLSSQFQRKNRNKEYRLSPPTFWRESRDEIIAVWRTRVYAQPLNDVGICPAQPMSPYAPFFPYLEGRWDPDQGRTVFLFGGWEKFKFGFSLLEKFYNRAFSILAKAPFKYGRPTGSGIYLDLEEFWKVAVKVHNELWIKNGTKPTQSQVAWELKLPLPTFKDYWSRTGVRWRDLPPPDWKKS